MSKTITYVLAFFMLISCAEKIVEKPENLIPKETMASILYDLAVLNATKSAAEHKMKEANINVMEFLYEKYQIDSVQFAQSDLYYASVPLEYQSIYENVEAILNEEKKDLEERSKKRSDSIRQASLRRKDSIEAIKAKEELKPIEP